jgi:alkylhydroperoxidase family enzyme
VSESAAAGAGFLTAPVETPEAQRLFDDDLAGVGYVTNMSRLWAHLPRALSGLADVMGEATQAGSISLLHRSVLVTAVASALGDSYCSMAWGKRLAQGAGTESATAVIRGDAVGLGPTEVALARWARLVATDPNAITAEDVQDLRDVGFGDPQIFAITTYAALRLAFSTVNDALGAAPDRELWQSLPEPLRSAISFGRPVDATEG